MSTTTRVPTSAITYSRARLVTHSTNNTTTSARTHISKVLRAASCPAAPASAPTVTTSMACPTIHGPATEAPLVTAMSSTAHSSGRR